MKEIPLLSDGAKLNLRKKRRFFKPRNFIFLLIIFLIFLGFYFWQKKLPKVPKIAKPVYLEVYRLVPEKISQSALIKINLPPGVDKEYAKQNIKFYPEIEGEWVMKEKKGFSFLKNFVFASQNQQELLFKPKEKLKLNRYYLVQLFMPDGGLIKADFLAVEDPKVIAIFPRENSEAPENSEITIVFNRPMVPLTTLGYLEEKEIPVEISPPTEGRFKWITTQNLQFIPKERLVRSSNYKVKVKSGLVSMDGLEVPPTEISFFTRKLRYLEITSGQIAYNQPISIYFNQPVDLEKTKEEITLIDLDTGKEIPFIAQYPKKSEGKEILKQREFFGFLEKAENFLAGIFPQLRKAEEEKSNQSVIQIYNQKDRFGREKLWDFKKSYRLIIKRAFPSEGDIVLEERKEIFFQVKDVIEGMSAESPRTDYASPEFFDPQGKLWVSFYEEIDLKKSKIFAPHLKEIGYGEKCKEGSETCEKVQDKKRIYLTFKSEEIGFSENIEIDFEKIVNVEGLTINKEPIKKSIISYPQFKILRTFPANDSSGASLTQLIICSNTPILAPAKEDFDKYFKANLDYEINYWSKSWKVEYPSPYEICQRGEFHTTIGYGLMPLSDYSLELNLEDVFGQKLTYSLSFRTGEMPSYYLEFYHLQNSYNVTTPQKTKLTYATQNMEFVDLEICKLNAYDFLYYLENRISWRQPTPSHICQKIIREKIELPKRYWLKNYFQVNIKDYFPDAIGHYILTFSNPNYKERYWEGGGTIEAQVYERTYLTVTNLAVAEKKIQPSLSSYGEREALTPQKIAQLFNIYWVVNLPDLNNVSGAKVELYGGKELSFLGSYFTDENGIAKTDVFSNLRGAIVKKDGDSTVIPSTQSKLEWAESAFLAKKIYLYTDKPIYRPGQEVFVKGIFRIGFDGNYEIYQDKKINLKVYNSKGDEILSRDLEVNDFGTFNTNFILEKNAPLGTYRICAEDYSCTYVEIQEYVPAPFEVKLKTDKEEYISKETVNLEVQANYYFGVPLEGGEVEYTISSQNYYFDRYKDEYFDFDSQWYWWEPYYYGEKFLFRGKTSLSSDGKAKISQKLDLEELFKEEKKSKIIVIDVTVKNLQGRSVSEQKSFILHAGEFYLGLKADKSFLAKNEKTNVRVKSVDTKGKEVKVKNISMNLYEIDWVYSKRQEAGGGYSYKWEKKRNLVKSWNFETDEKGNFVQEIRIEKEGSYEIEVLAKDRKGNSISTVYNIYVWGEREVPIRPTKETELELEAEKRDLKVDEEGKIIIKSPYSKAKALISIERGKIFEYRIKEISGNLSTFDFQVKEEYIPNIFVSVLIFSPEGEVKYGKIEFKIDIEKKKLNIEVSSNKKFYLPGEEVTLDILVKDDEGKPVSAELSVSVVDLSVLALKGNPKKNPLIFFYGGFPLAVQTSANFKSLLVELEIPTKGGAGMAPEALAKKVRGVFRETAFWQAVIRTDEEGKAQVKFTLPDNLTTWQTETIGVTKDTKLGINYQEFLTKKELMVIPLKPRFIIPGDSFEIGAQIFNQSEKKQNLIVKFESESLILNDEREKKISIEPEKTETVYFKVQAPADIERGEHKFLISAKGEELEDTVLQSINITPNNTYEVTASSNYTSEKIFKEYVFLPEEIVKDRGSLTIKSSATLAVFLSDSLNYLLQFPYGCSEQIASKLKAIAVVKRGLNLPNLAEKFKLEKIKDREGKEYTIEEVVQIGLQELYNNQKWDGGFSFWRYGESNFYLTLHVLDTLNLLSLAGFEVDQNVLNRAANYLYQKITTDYRIYQDKNNVILTAYTLFNLPSFKKDGLLREKIVEIVKDDLFLKERISNTSLSYLAILMTKGFDESLKKKVFETLDNRIDIDARGAFLEPNKNFLWYYYETPIKDTALYLKAKVAARDDDPILEKVLRWILNSRKKDGAWGSTNNTLAVIDSLTDFLEWKRETESDFILEILLNEESLGSFHFNPQTILDQFKKEVQIKDLKFNQNNIVEFKKENKNPLLNSYYYDLSLKYYLPAEKIPPRDEGFTIVRNVYTLEDKEGKNPISQAKVGDVLRVNLQITVPKTRNYVMIEDFIPAGMEIVNLDLATEQKSLRLQERELKGREFYPDFKEIHDDRAFLFKENVPPGVYEFDYYVRALIKGKFTHLPAVISEMYFPENFGRTAGGYFEIK
jgi:uncharacterized protein YfaS (alpha-2-macroglobulin family)